MIRPRRLLSLALPGFALLVVALSWGCRGEPAGEGKISGTVGYRGKPIAMALVQAYAKPEQDRATPPVEEMPSASDGSFEMTVPAGRYWVWAKATLEEGGREVRLVGQAVPNPVEPASGRSVAVKIELSDPSGFSASAGPVGTGVRGRVSGAGSGGERVTVYVYPGRFERPVGPGFAAAVEPDEKGAFTVPAAPGGYTLAVRVRRSGRDYGPPAPGDRVAVRTVEIGAGTYADVGEIVLAPLDPEVWKTVTASPGGSATRITGTVKGGDGRPAAGVRVLAFRDGRMTGKPAAVSPPTGPAGSYTLALPEAGTYFLGARSRLGGPASPGEKVGQNRGADGGGIVVGAGQSLPGIDIVVEEVW